MTDEDIYVGTLMGIAEMINNGVTVFADHYFGEEQVLKAVRRLDQGRPGANLVWDDAGFP